MNQIYANEKPMNDLRGPKIEIKMVVHFAWSSIVMKILFCVYK